MLRVVLAGFVIFSSVHTSFALSPEDDASEAATTLARIDVCESGISRSERAALVRRMKIMHSGIDGMSFYQDEKARLLSESANARARDCETVQSYETN